jgi:hypothetical protein
MYRLCREEPTVYAADLCAEVGYEHCNKLTPVGWMQKSCPLTIDMTF